MATLENYKNKIASYTFFLKKVSLILLKTIFISDQKHRNGPLKYRRCLLSVPTISIKCLPLLFLPSVTATDIAPTQFEQQTPCPFVTAKNVDTARLTCGYLIVAENRRNSQSATLKLPVAIIKTLAPHPKPDPVVFLTGGPGASAISSSHTFTLFAKHPFGQDRDIIVFTQRGGLLSEPDLSCPDLGAARQFIYLADHTLKERDKTIADLAIKCLQESQKAGRDITGYSALENAHDLLEMRTALGIKKWNLMGVSYGTYIALEAARLDHSGIRSMILDSLVSMESDVFMAEGTRNLSLGLSRLFNACAEQPPCNTAIPDSASNLSRILTLLTAHPVTISLDGANGPVEMIVNWHDFLGLVHWMLYNAKTLPLVPILIETTAKADFELMTILMNKVFPAPSNKSESAAGAFFAVVCQDQYTRRSPLPVPPSSLNLQGFSIAGFLRDICSHPALPYGQQETPRLVKSSVPTLLLTGEFDPITPDIYAAQVAQNMPNSSLIRIKNYGHSTLSGYTACQTDMATAFLDDLLPKAGFPCLKIIPAVAFPLSKQQAFSALGIQKE